MSEPLMSRTVFMVNKVNSNPTEVKGKIKKEFLDSIVPGSIMMIEFPLSFHSLIKGGVRSFPIEITNLDTRDSYKSSAGTLKRLWDYILDYTEININT